MNAGLLWDTSILQYQIAGANTYTRSGTQGVAVAAGLTSEFSLDAILTSVGIELTIGTAIASGALAGAGTWYERLRVPALSIDENDVGTTGWQTALSTLLELDDFQLWLVYVSGVFRLRVKASDLRFYTSSGLYYTHGAAIELDSSFFAPSGIPLHGVAPTLQASAAVNPAITQGALAGVCEVRNTYASAEITATGGYRYKVRGESDWSELPVNLYILAPPALACDVSAPRSDPVATSSWGAEVTAYQASSDVATFRGVEECDECTNGTAIVPATFNVWDRVVQWWNRSSQVTLLPNLPKSVKRWGDGSDYLAYIQRDGFPWSEGSSAAYCTDWWLDTTDSDSSVLEFNAEYAASKVPVFNTPHAIEDPFGEVTFAPYAIGTTYFRARNFCAELLTPGTCPAVEPEMPPGTIINCITGNQDAFTSEIVSQFVPVVQESSGTGSNPYMLPYLDHAEALHRYVNFTANPHWSFSYRFPPNTLDTDDDTIPDKQDEWLYDGNEMPYEFYTDTRRQWLHNDGLVGGDDSKLTNSLVSPPLRDGVMSLVWKAIWETETSPWGITRYIPYKLQYPTSTVLDATSDDRWYATNATLSFTTVVVVNPSAASSVVNFDLASLIYPPYMHLQVCDSVALGWNVANVDNIKVYLVNAVGEEFLITDNVQGTFNYVDMIATLADTVYAGSWKQDFGVGYVIDEGSDNLISGKSSDTMSGSERVTAFQLLHGLQGATLRFKITATDHTSTNIELDYPEFFSPSAPRVFQEQGHHAAIIHENGPGVRFGSWRWYDYFLTTALVTPVVEPPGTRWVDYGHKSSILDFLRFNNLVVVAEAYDDDFAADIALFDADEGSTDDDAAIDTLSFLVNEETETNEVFGILVNTWREVPPLAMFPWRERGTDFAPTGDFVQESWSLVQGPRRYISSSGEIHLTNPADSSTWTALEQTIGNWKITSHEHAIDNDEPQFNISHNSVNLALGRPFWGYFSVVPDEFLGVDVFNNRSLDYNVHRDNHHHTLFIQASGTLLAGESDNYAPVLTNVVSNQTPNWIKFHMDTGGSERTMYVLYGISGSAYLATSTDFGKNIGGSMDLGAGVAGDIVCGEDNNIYVYRNDSGTVRLTILDKQLNVVKAVATNITDADADSAIAVDESYIENGWRILILYKVADSQTLLSSTDGINFS